MQTSALATISAQPDSSRIDELVRQRVARLAECIRRDGAPYPLTAQLVNVWVDVFASANVTPEQVDAAFSKAERSLKSFWPSPGEVMAFISTAETSTTEEEATQKWDKVLEYAVRRSPDIREKNPPRISEHTRRAINAAGGLDFLRDCDRESLQWARKRFIEAYVRYTELQQDQYLLPAGELKTLLAEFSETKALPASEVCFEELHKHGLEYAEELKAKSTLPIPKPAHPPRRGLITPEQLEQQKKAILSKYAMAGGAAKV